MSEAHGYNYYIKIWAILMVLLVVSIVGPTLEIMIVTLITAFGVALVKALMVAAYFMHLNIEKKYIWLLLIGALLFLLGLYLGLLPDIQKTEGSLWKRCNAYNDANRARIAAEAKIAEDHHPGLVEHIQEINGGHLMPVTNDCTPQRF